MPASPFSYPRAEQPVVDTERLPARVGKRVSLHHCVVLFLLFDLLTILGLGIVPALVTDHSPSALVDEQAPAIGVFVLLYFSIAQHGCL